MPGFAGLTYLHEQLFARKAVAVCGSATHPDWKAFYQYVSVASSGLQITHIPFKKAALQVSWTVTIWLSLVCQSMCCKQSSLTVSTISKIKMAVLCIEPVIVMC